MVAPVVDTDWLVGELVARVAGFGVLQEFLDDPSVEEKCVKPRPRHVRSKHGYWRPRPTRRLLRPSEHRL